MVQDDEPYVESDGEDELQNGIKIEIRKDLNQENTAQYIEQIEKQKVYSFSIRKNRFEKLGFFQLIVNALIKNKNLRSFIFTDNYNTTGFEEGWKMIISLLKENKYIRNVNLSMSFLYDKYLSALLQSFKGKRIKSLDLSSNFITYLGCKKISDWLKTNKSLKILNLQQNTRNEFKREGSDILVEQLINHQSIISLDLSNMILTDLGVKMGELIATSKNLKELKIKNIRMNLEDYKNICTPLY